MHVACAVWQKQGAWFMRPRYLHQEPLDLLGADGKMDRWMAESVPYQAGCSHSRIAL